MPLPVQHTTRSFFFPAEDGIRADLVTGVQTCALPIFSSGAATPSPATFQASHAFTNPGVYTINVCVKDSTGTNGCASVWIVVYDPNGGFVTGRGQNGRAAGRGRAGATRVRAGDDTQDG